MRVDQGILNMLQPSGQGSANLSALAQPLDSNQDVRMSDPDGKTVGDPISGSKDTADGPMTAIGMDHHLTKEKEKLLIQHLSQMAKRRRCPMKLHPCPQKMRKETLMPQSLIKKRFLKR